MRVNEYFKTKTEMLIEMLRSAISSGIRFDYLLTDSWFTNFELVKFIATRRIGCFFLGMVKNGNTKYLFQGKEITFSEILKILKHSQKANDCKKLKCKFYEAEVTLKGIQIKLFYCKTTKRSKWHGLLTTNTDLTFEKAFEIYATRWTIEVFFKECKQLLRLGKCELSESNDIWGPYEGKLIINDSMGWGEGASQGSIVDMEDGSTQTEGSWMGYFMLRRGAAGRGLVLTDCTFDEDGWPVVADSNLKLKNTMNVPVEGTFEKKSIVESYDFDNGLERPKYTYFKLASHPDLAETSAPGENDYNGSNLKLGWEWNHNPDNRYWSLTARLGYLRLTNGSMVGNVTQARNVLTTRTYGPQSTGSVAMEISEMKDGDVAGLAAFNRVYAYVGVKMVNGRKYVVYR